MSPKDQKNEFDFQKGIVYRCGEISKGEKIKAKTDKKRNGSVQPKQLRRFL
jgi:hypothetical protein